MTDNRPLLWTLGLLGFAFLVSLVLFLFVPGHLSRAVLSFPEERTHRTVSEVRYLPFNGHREHDAALLVNEILLGPLNYDHMRLFSREGRVNSVLTKRGRVFIDLTKASLFPDQDVLYSPAKALEILRSTVTRNIGGVSEVDVSFGGEPAEVFHVDKG